MIWEHGESDSTSAPVQHGDTEPQGRAAAKGRVGEGAPVTLEDPEQDSRKSKSRWNSTALKGHL